MLSPRVAARLPRALLARWSNGAALHALVDDARSKRTLDRVLSAEQKADLESRVRELEGALEGDEPQRLERADRALRDLAAPAVLASERRQWAISLGSIALAAAAAMVLHGGVIGSYRVLSSSMRPTLEPDDLLGARMLRLGSRTPSRGDIIVFDKPSGVVGPDKLVKRVIGLPGDRIAMNGAHAVINGWEVPSCNAGAYVDPTSHDPVSGRVLVEFLDDRSYLVLSTAAPNWSLEYEVQPNEVFVLGDNRGNSSDSRAWNLGKGGGLSIGSIDGRVAWWLLGEGRDHKVDLNHGQMPLELRPHLKGLDTHSLEEGIERCLQNRPSATHPPERRHGS
jgi:signal peptidase I